MVGGLAMPDGLQPRPSEKLGVDGYDHGLAQLLHLQRHPLAQRRPLGVVLLRDLEELADVRVNESRSDDRW